MSVSEYIEQKFKTKKVENTRTVEDIEIDKELEEIDREVDFLIQKKIEELSFEVKDELADHPEVEEVQVMIERTVDHYR